MTMQLKIKHYKYLPNTWSKKEKKKAEREDELMGEMERISPT